MTDGAGMGKSHIPLSAAGRLVCMLSLETRIRELTGQLAHYTFATNFESIDTSWVNHQELLIATLTDDLEHLRDD